MTIKIEFPADRKDIALILGKALCEIGGEKINAVTVSGTPISTGHTVEDDKTDLTNPETIEEITSHEQLAADGAGLIEDTTEDVPPPVETDDVTPPTNDSELDSRGFPWDARIHSKNKSKNDDGSWRYARKPKNFETKEQWNIFIEQTEEELKGSDVPPPVDNTAGDDVPPPSEEPNPSSLFGNDSVDDVPPPVDNTASDDVPPPSDSYEEKTFGELMTLITSNQKNKSVEKINEVLTEMGILNPNGSSALPVLKSDHPERISEVYAKLEGKL